MIIRLIFFCGSFIFALSTGFAQSQLVSPEMIKGDRIEKSLTGHSGSPQRGRDIFMSRTQGHCILCHQLSDIDAEFQGNLGPSLDTVGARLSAAQIRLRIVDYASIKPDTIMPSYYRIYGLRQVADGHEGQPMLSSQMVEDLVIYLSTQKGND